MKSIDFRGFSGPKGCWVPPLERKRKNVTPLDKFLIRHLILLFREYTYCDTPGDTELSTFNLTVDDTLYKIPYINQAKQISNKQVSLITLPSIFIFKEIIRSYSHTMKTIIQSNNEDDFQFWFISIKMFSIFRLKSLQYLN